ncbi:MAG: efflux RND transporter periplasmic adaptor subunit [Phycisphaerales bacterium]|nr:efflux RND transporter periplasmic adaptor subunit [Phycisphaerales bacterium]
MIRRFLFLVAAAILLVAFSAQVSPSPSPLRGQTEPAAHVDVPAGMKGLLLSVDVTQGQLVKKGDKLAQLDDAVQQQVVALAKMQADSTAEIRLARNQLDSAKLENEIALTNPSVNEFEKRQKHLAVIQTEIVVERDLEKQKEAQANLAKEQILLDHMTIKSPIDGFVLRVNKHAGEATDENPLVVVVQVNKLHAVFYPPKQLFGHIKVGDKVDLELALEPAISRQARVIAVDPIIDPASQLFQVKMELDNADALIPAGTTATWIPR